VKKVALFQLPHPSTAQAEDPKLVASGGNLLVHFRFSSDDGDVPWQIRFEKVRAFHKLSEPYCTVWHIEDAYDTLCRVDDSEWAAELSRRGTKQRAGSWVMNHYVLTVDSWGCLEVVAESATALEAEGS
jgi:hypothetical protein